MANLKQQLGRSTKEILSKVINMGTGAIGGMETIFTKANSI